MPTWPQHQKSLAKWVKAVLPDRYVVLDNAHGVAQQTPWAMVRLLSDAGDGPPERRVSDNAGNAQHRAILPRRGTVSITLAEDDHHADAIELLASLGDPDIIVLLESLNIAIIRDLGVAHLGSDSDATTQNRTVIDFEFSHTHMRTSAHTKPTESATATGSFDPS